MQKQHRSAINEELLLQFADWGMNLKGIGLMSKTHADINHANVDLVLNVISSYFVAANQFCGPMSDKT